MTDTVALALSREHLAQNRRMIIGRSLMSALAGLLPVPVVDEWMSSRILRGTIRRIADQRGVDIDDDAVASIADGSTGSPEWSVIASAGMLVRSLSRTWKKVMIAVVTTERARHAADVYTVATLFDHYCAKLHVGLGLNAARGRELRELMNACVSETRGGLATPVFKRALVAATRATVKAPVELLDLVSGGRVRKLLARHNEIEAVAEVDAAIEASIDAERGLLARAARAAEVQITADGNPYLDELLSCFEQRCRRNHD